MEFHLRTGILAVFMLAVGLPQGSTSDIFMFRNIDNAMRRFMDSVSGSGHKHQENLNVNFKGLQSGFKSPFKTAIAVIPGLGIGSSALKSEVKAARSPSSGRFSLPGVGISSPDAGSQLKDLVSTNSGLKTVPVGSVRVSSQVQTGSQTSYGGASSTTSWPSSVQTTTSSTPSGYATNAFTGQRVPCTPDYSGAPTNGHCVMVDQLEEQCGATFEAAQSAKHCGAFDGNWCCYVPSPAHASSTLRPSSVMTSTSPVRTNVTVSSQYMNSPMSSAASTATTSRAPTTSTSAPGSNYGTASGLPANKLSIAGSKISMGPFTFAEIMKTGRGQRLKAGQASLPSFGELLHQAMSSPEFANANLDKNANSLKSFVKQNEDNRKFSKMLEQALG